MYLFKASLLTGVFYLFHLILLRKETFFSLNRFMLLGGLMLSFILPALPSIRLHEAPVVIAHMMEGVTVTNKITAKSELHTVDMFNPWVIIYITGATWFGLRFLTGIGKVGYLWFRFPKTSVNGRTVIIIKGDLAPFTFFNLLFVGESDLRDLERSGIIAHELTHIKKLHSLDLLMIETACIALWFNPLIWLYRHALRSEHEYEADDQVIKKGYNARIYRQLLFERTVGLSAMGPVNHFNYSVLYNRMKMMSKNRSGSRAILKYVLIIPLIGMLSALTLFKGDLSDVLPHGHGNNKDSVYNECEVMPVYPGGIMAIRTFIAENLKYPEIAARQGVEGKVFIQFTVGQDAVVKDIRLAGSNITVSKGDEIKEFAYREGEKRSGSEYSEAIDAIEQEALRVVALLPDYEKPGYQDGKAVNVQYTFPITYALK